MKRIESLDALRGIAAMIVVIHHCALAMPGVREWMQSTMVLRPLVAGPAAVMTFFVLSGFVLYMALAHQGRFQYAPYIAKRVTRIYPPLVAAVAISAMLYAMSSPLPVAGLNPWFNANSWNIQPDGWLIAGHLLLLDGTDYQSLDNVMWSLVHEMRIMVVFPFIALALRRSTTATLLLTGAVSLIAMSMVQPSGARDIVNPLATMQYVFLFAAGAAIAKHGDRIKRFVNRDATGMMGPAMLVIGVVLGLCVQRTSAIGAVFLVSACFAYRPAARALSRPALEWLGKISYSLYLVHIPIMLAMVHTLNGWIDLAGIIALVIPASLVVAAIGHRWIEVPSMKLGRELSRRLRRQGCADPINRFASKSGDEFKMAHHMER